jgi:protein-S-isoprenylcysteine O-methyltransferase Ste14
MEPTTIAPAERRTAVVQVGSLRLEGGAAVVALLVLLGGIIALFWWRGMPRWHVFMSAALWICFMSYWSAAAKTAAPTKSSESAASRRTHVRLMNAGLILLFVPSFWVLGLRFLPASAWLIALGLGLQIGAGVLGVWARLHLGRNWSGAVTVAQEHQLVRSGPYRKLRHPIYTAMIGMFVGSAIAIGEWHSVLGVALIVIAYARKIPLEEQTLQGVFGEEYEDYRRSTWALIPGVL